MKTRKAINILKKQMDKLMSLSLDDNNNHWIVQTSTYLELFFGKDSYQISYFKDKSGYLFKETARTELNVFLNDCIEVISNKGLYKTPKNNFLSTIPDWLLSMILPALVVLGTLIGKYLSDVQNIELKRENTELNEKLSLISTDSITNKNKNLSNEPKQEN